MKKTFLMAAVLLFSSAFSGLAFAQPHAYPTRSIRMIVPVAAGNGTDALARLFALEMSKLLMQPVVVENKPGAGGEIAASEAARAPADGYTLLFANTSIFSANKFMYPKSHDLDLVPIIKLTETPFVLLSGSTMRGKNLTEVLSAMRSSQHPSPIGAAATVYSIGAGLLREASGVNMQLIPYQSSAKALNDLHKGDIDIMFESVNTGAGLVSDGRLRALGITSEKRAQILPNVPTMKEMGLDFSFNAWTMIAAPKDLPAPIVQKINQTMNTILNTPEMRQRMTLLGTEIAGGTTEEVIQGVRDESKRIGEIITKFNLKP